MIILICLLVSLLSSGLLTAVLMRWLLQYCYKRNLFDIPNERKMHRNNIPRLGGVVFVPCVAVGLSLGLFVMLHTSAIPDQLKMSTILLGCGLLVIYLIGLLDDLLGLAAGLKFFVQFLASLSFPMVGLCLNNLNGLFGIYEIPFAVACPLTVFLVLSVVNAVNMIDGIDGLCSGLSMMALVVFGYFFYQEGLHVFCLFDAALVGTLLVFMCFNLFGTVERRTKTFMGDSGSLMLGFGLSYMGLKLSVTGGIVAPPAQGVLIPLSVLFIPVVDMARVSVMRIARGVHPFHPDKTHIHHLLMQAGLSQRRSLLVLLCFNGLVIALNMMLWQCSLSLNWILLLDLALYALMVFTLCMLRKEA